MSSHMDDDESGCILGGMEESVIMGAVSEEKRVISTNPRSWKNVPWLGEETDSNKGVVLKAVDDFLERDD